MKYAAYAYLALLVLVALTADWLQPYAASATDLTAMNYRAPGEAAGHWLGTDRLGRDTLAGLINGTRVAVVVGLGTLGLSLLIGVPLGALAGFLGDDRLRLPRWVWWGVALGFVVGIGYALGVAGEVAWLLRPRHKVLLYGSILLGFPLLTALSFWLLSRWLSSLRVRTTVPVDTLIVQLIEVFNSIPGLVLLITVLTLVRNPTIWSVVIVIGVLQWTAIARFLRAELLKIRDLPYLEAARVHGVPRWRRLFVHALPNAVGPLFVVAAFGVGGAILSEAMLSFLGIGIPAEEVTWGSLLRQSRDHPAAWWLAVFPGVLLTGTVLALNVVGERA